MGHHRLSPDHRVSIYVFGDEFTGSSIDKVVRAVDALNATGPDDPYTLNFWCCMDTLL